MKLRDDRFRRALEAIRDPSEWRDSHFAVRGPAVDPLRSAFISDWRDAAGEMFADDVIPDRPEPAGNVALGVIDASAEIELNTAGRTFEAIVALARHRLWITTPYFNPSDRLTRLLAEAVERGVAVRLMIPGDHIDKRVSLISAEEQARILVEDEEVVVVAIDPDLNQVLASDFLSDLDHCDVVLDPEELHRSATEKAVGKLTAPIQGEL